ncbi:MAG: hypothetical protein Q9173_002804 [Seirophora scorigena]
MSANNSQWKGVVGNKWNNVGVVEDKPDESANRRRSSSTTKYAGLMAQKRNSSDAAATARKASFAEQTKAPGFLGGLWNKFDHSIRLNESVVAYSFDQFHQRWSLRQEVRKARWNLAGGHVFGHGLQAFFFSPYAPTLFRSYGVQNIEKRYSAGGGSHNHTPGQATKLGDSSSVTGNQQAPKGMGTPHYNEKIGEQKPEKGSQFDKAWNKAQYGSEKGK